MAAEPVRVALLARPGPARDRLRAVIEEAAVDCVLEADPGELEPEALVAAAPQLVLVALEAQVEEALERFDPVLFDPAVDVVYEEAELAAGREGWEVARWQRHLVAKLQRHGSVLPPGHEPEEDAAAGGGPGGMPEPPAPEPEPAVPAAEPEPAASPFDPVLAESGDEGFEPAPAFPPEPASGPVSREPVPEAEAGAEMETAARRPEVLSLDDGAGMAPGGADEAEARGRFERDLDILESRIAGLQLVDDAPPAAGPSGAVVVLAGIGGPDAVRQLLGALPPTLPRPVLVRQQLDGARYDKLVAQMQRISPLPVTLAQHGAPLERGVVHIVPPELGLAMTPDGPRFTTGGELLDVLPPGDSAVVLLSGSDPTLVDGLMKQRLAGALVVGQVAEGCYDPAASLALKNRGGDTATPVQLAARIADRWPGGGESA
ncbi:chemotaxis protein [Lysobacter sp. GX 14042]|uniref:chemotaxis protein CheB n=1 Tax=Lysobacter sp. GX 14042 TaxID=2907155 RepID=UPI001F1BF7E3|nr:chemotaxis protein CheB [Lysobacter sp. GX 14042]MCE7031108.1 chemotaxis protein [Lysobacter sp. GX 14042]